MLVPPLRLKGPGSVSVYAEVDGTEYKLGHIKGAVNLDILVSTFQTKIKALDKKAHYLVHCQSGKRSTSAALSPTKLAVPWTFCTVSRAEVTSGETSSLSNERIVPSRARAARPRTTVKINISKKSRSESEPARTITQSRVVSMLKNVTSCHRAMIPRKNRLRC